MIRQGPVISQGEYQIEIFPVSEFPAEFSWKGVDRDGVLASSVIKMATLDKLESAPTSPTSIWLKITTYNLLNLIVG